jgi:DNA (cytosine-5)-methyltransferase 1
MTHRLLVGSLFSGIGGIDLGLEATGRFQIAWQVERDPYCRYVLARHWPHVPRFPDVCTVKGADLAPIDVLCGGFPCQDVSLAGKRAGLSGERSGLWSHFVRLIRELRPRYVLVENVPALLTPVRRRGRGEPAPLASVLGDLAACGYDAEWEVLPASAFGAPHVRRRLFVLAYPCVQRLQTHFTSSQLFSLPKAEAGNGVADGRSVSSWRADTQRLVWQAEPDVARVVDGLPHWVDRVRSLGNAVVPLVAYQIGWCLIAAWQESQQQAQRENP